MGSFYLFIYFKFCLVYLVSVAIIGLGPDFTRTKSFGFVDTFAESLVASLDRSWKRPPVVTTKLINSKAAKGFYYIEYTIPCKTLERHADTYFAVRMAKYCWYNRPYMMTGQVNTRHE
ncbi:hypothetical protein QJS04_geneDACA014963 [Acorus gramineus]|uniref:PsbP C-terminal domain-containing protein n=1 Tax=Acorus gramineus TaxID=55184 RepID=A0AAV9BTT9_ACOGR|nr:hypothetical protein QJS04_geneDACA014963 [Acorus gramineus]